MIISNKTNLYTIEVILYKILKIFNFWYMWEKRETDIFIDSMLLYDVNSTKLSLLSSIFTCIFTTGGLLSSF